MVNRPEFVDAGPARRHVKRHVKRGGSLRYVAKQAGVAHTTIIRLAAGKYLNVEARVARQVLAVPTRPSNVGCARRVEALFALGHPISHMATAGGCNEATLYAAWRRESFTDPIAHAVVRAYGQLRGKPGPDKRVAAFARKRGCHLPRAWDGVDIDDPTAAPLVFGPTGRPRDVKPFTSEAYFTAVTGLPVTRWAA